MTVSADDVRRLAALAELELPPGEVDRVARELRRILAYVNQLGSHTAVDEAALVVAGPERAPLRPDVVHPIPLDAPLETFACDLRDGHFIMPPPPGVAAKTGE